MKKTLVIITLAIYIASIAVVNLFGLEVTQFDGTTYVSAIQCDTVTFVGDNLAELAPKQYIGADNNIPLFIFDFIPALPDSPYTAEEESLLTNQNVIQINYEVLPHLAESAEIKFEHDEASGVAVFHELSSSFIFLVPNKVHTITIRATDGSNVSTQVAVMGRLQK